MCNRAVCFFITIFFLSIIDLFIYHVSLACTHTHTSFYIYCHIVTLKLWIRWTFFFISVFALFCHSHILPSYSYLYLSIGATSYSIDFFFAMSAHDKLLIRTGTCINTQVTWISVVEAINVKIRCVCVFI